MNITTKIFLFLISLALFVYVSPQSPEFPEPPEGSLQSREPADSEDPMRRAYFVNLDRAEVIAHYKNKFENQYKIPSIRLNYPPEEAQSIIRDQTRSTYLEEIVYPLRESIYINGFEPKSEKDTIIIEDKVWEQKIIIKYVQSPLYLRLIIMALTLVSAYLLVREYAYVKKH